MMACFALNKHVLLCVHKQQALAVENPAVLRHAVLCSTPVACIVHLLKGCQEWLLWYRLQAIHWIAQQRQSGQMQLSVYTD